MNSDEGTAGLTVDAGSGHVADAAAVFIVGLAMGLFVLFRRKDWL